MTFPGCYSNPVPSGGQKQPHKWANEKRMHSVLAFTPLLLLRVLQPRVPFRVPVWKDLDKVSLKTGRWTFWCPEIPIMGWFSCIAKNKNTGSCAPSGAGDCSLSLNGCIYWEKASKERNRCSLRFCLPDKRTLMLVHQLPSLGSVI